MTSSYSRSAFAVVFAVVMLVVASVCVAATTSPGKGEVGGPPTVTLGPPDEGTQTSPALVIGVGSVVDGPVQIVAYGWEPEADSLPADFCIWIEQPHQLNQFGTCGTALSEGRGIKIVLDSKTQLLRPRAQRATAIGGRISPDVAAVRLYVHRPGGHARYRVNAVVAQVDGDIQKRLGQPAPFGFFYAKVRGLVGFSDFHAQALDAQGNVIGTS